MPGEPGRTSRPSTRSCARRAERWAAVVAVLLGLAAPASASKLWSQPTPDSTAAEYRQQMALGDRHAIDAAEVKASRLASSARRPRAYLVLVERAISAYEAAARARPDAADPHYRAAEVIYEHLLDSDDSSPVIIDRQSAERALAHWRAFEERAPLDPRGTTLLFRRALLHTKLADEDSLKRAIDDYETLLRRSDLDSSPSQNVATWLANLAETHMMVGHLDSAIAVYERALGYSNEPLYGYGLAVALDRDGQGERARQLMRTYAHGDGLRSLTRKGVFFVPEGEIHYYLALGSEALGRYQEALFHYKEFVASGAHPRYQGRAQANLERVRTLVAKSARAGRSVQEGRGP